jgi:hypothetical protein
MRMFMDLDTDQHSQHGQAFTQGQSFPNSSRVLPWLKTGKPKSLTSFEEIINKSVLSVFIRVRILIIVGSYGT